MNNFKKFANTAAYEAATLTRPAVSLIETSGKIKFDPDTYHGIVRVYYNITDASQEVVLYAGSSSGSESGSESGSGQAGATPSAMWVDGVLLQAVVNTYRFSTNGIHYVDYDFDGAVFLSGGLFYHNQLVTKVVLNENVEDIGSQAFQETSNLSVFISKAITPPSLNNSIEFNMTSPDLVIYVPAASVNAYKTAWFHYTDKIQAM